ncbi:hypothetical protein ACROYT_G037413 [Oculina patagonica]
MIARVYSPDGSAWTEEGDYKKYPDQISKEIILNAGKKYYIESLSKQGSGAAHVAVYWSYRNSTFEIISSKYLSSCSENNNHESIPAHVGKQKNTLLQSKNDVYYFNRLPLIGRKEFINLIPTCPYSPSFLVRRKLQRYQGVWLKEATQGSRVFPQDDTDMFINGSWKHDWKKPNALVDKNRVESIVGKLINSLQRSRKYFLKKIHKVIHKPDPKNGDRFLLNLELRQHQSIISAVRTRLTNASLLTGDTNFHVIIIDFKSKDIDINKAFNTSLLRSRHSVVSLPGKFYKTLALNVATEFVPNAYDIIFLFDLHIDVPAAIMDSVRMNTIAGRMVYSPTVGRLDCESSSVEHGGFWQMDGYGVMAMYKSDWDRLGGMNIKDFKHKWGGEDWDLLDRVLMLPVEVERIKYPGFYHHYHAKQKKWN